MQRYPRVVLYDHSYETLAIQFLAATLQERGFETEVYFDCSMDRDYLGQDFFLKSWFSLPPESVAEQILALAPDVVGFSVITVFFPTIKKIIAALKNRKPDLFVVCGGPHCNLIPHQVLKNCQTDFVFQGDADQSFPRFLHSMRNHSRRELFQLSAKELPGIANRWQGEVLERGFGPYMENLDEVPFPLKTPYYRKNPMLSMLYTTTCSRGCCFQCTYCNSNNLRRLYHEHGMPYFRTRSVGHVLSELKMAQERYHPRFVMFLDNLFSPGKAWLKEFAVRYPREIGLPFFCETNPRIHTKETVELLAQAGCQIIQFGFQSSREEVRREILHRFETNRQITDLVSVAKKSRVFVCLDHIANLPGETPEHLEHACEFYSQLRPDWINLGFLQYYPQADILEIAKSRQALFQENLPEVEAGEHQSSFRLLAKSRLSPTYRTLAWRMFFAFKGPSWLRQVGNLLLEHPLLSKLMAKWGSLFIYGSRILFAFSDRRDFLVRHHVYRNLGVVFAIFKERIKLWSARRDSDR